MDQVLAEVRRRISEQTGSIAKKEQQAVKALKSTLGNR
jgi:hypothetical protein